MIALMDRYQPPSNSKINSRSCKGEQCSQNTHSLGQTQSTVTRVTLADTLSLSDLLLNILVKSIVPLDYNLRTSLDMHATH